MLAFRVFDEKDQAVFAALSGDYNPMHMDSVAARRTQAGAPVVHGIHSLVWLLDTIAVAYPTLPSIASLKVRFMRMVYLGERVDAKVTQTNDRLLQATLSVEDVVAVQLSIAFGPWNPSAARELPGLILRPTSPLELSLEEMSVQAGRIAFATLPIELARTYSGAARLLGDQRLAAVCCSTLLVGMVVPGLHSIYSGLTFAVCEQHEPSGEIAFKVASVDSRFRLVRLEIWGSGLSGTVDCFARQPPVEQPSIAHVARFVSAGEFAGAKAFVVGGSRGLGELVAKIVAAGGGKVVVSYAVGRAEAEKLQTEITTWGGTCEIVPYDVRESAEVQLSKLAEAPTHYYYFATPVIYVRKTDCFTQRRFEEFGQFYLTGFYALIQAAMRRRPEGIAAFYPSTVFVEERTPGMTEYAMAKVAGEILCADMNAQLRNVRIITSRLPRLPTDQTTSLIPERNADALETLLPLVREVQRY